MLRVKEDLVMKQNLIFKAFIIMVACFASCAGNYGAGEGGFDASICNNIPVGIERFEYLNPEDERHKISCADVERCTSIMGWDAPPNVPCVN